MTAWPVFMRPRVTLRRLPLQWMRRRSWTVCKPRLSPLCSNSMRRFPVGGARWCGRTAPPRWMRPVPSCARTCARRRWIYLRRSSRRGGPIRRAASAMRHWLAMAVRGEYLEERGKLNSGADPTFPRYVCARNSGNVGAVPGFILPLLSGGVAVAGGAAVVEDDLPLAIRFAPPDGIEGAGAFAGRIAHGAGGHGESAGVEHLDGLGRPGERGLRAVEEGLPAVGDLCGATGGAAAGHEYGFGGEE